eukprot:CAMPEP_0177178762 /NCGR_PEP_ID=MMETSP0367-20130122/14499_1 /TAXON_ID=447022 ORGANISM="Scrippsiella hangoei-like, Strain SHHI-4" /NCGR_SAMPLE_ID=MMETSP0367 /ASSEMBLY_ACC=CAM_ASM_000362 /LENGTH=43 /DNA_ID= /DNA_START= /DNA_END= /DNA_ORIENTATION=
MAGNDRKFPALLRNKYRSSENATEAKSQSHLHKIVCKIRGGLD